MKHYTQIFALLIFVFSSSDIFAQSVGINNTSPDPTAVLDITSNDKGVLVPRVTTAQRTAIGGGTPATGLLVYDTNVNSFFFYNGTTWIDLSDAGSAWTETTNEVYTNKDVGIGITSPEQTLDIGGTGTQYARITSTNGATNGIEFVRQGGGQDWRWTNSSGFFDLYTQTNDFSSTSTSDIVATFSNSGRLGIGTISPLAELHIVGTIRNSTLAGSGNRPLVANASGDIEISAAGSTKYWVSNGFAFNSASSSFTYGSIAFNTSGTTSLWAPVNLPHGATVTSFYINYGDISTVSNLNVRLLRVNIPGQFLQSTMADITSSGTPGASSPAITDFTITDPVINNTNSTYVIEVRPAPGFSWDGNRINIRNVRISYTLPY